MDRTIDALPCPVLITDVAGSILFINAALHQLIGDAARASKHDQLDDLMAPASRIFLQTHLWPMLMREGQFNEVYLHLVDANRVQIPVIVNARRDDPPERKRICWVFMAAQERSKFEVELLAARKRAEDAAQALDASLRFVHAITDAMPGLVAYWDRGLVCRYANISYLAWFGRAPEQMLGMHLRDLLGESLFAANGQYIQGALAGQPQAFELSLTRRDGSVRHTMAHYIPDRDPAGVIAGFHVMVTDITALKETELRLQLAASVFDNTIEGILVTDARARVISVNPAFTAITGFSAAEVIGHTPRVLSSGREGRAVHAAMRHELALTGRWAGEAWARRKDGNVFLVRQTVTAISGGTEEPVRYVSVFNDITERWHADERMRYLASHDALTGLPNRSFLVARLMQLLATAERESRRVAVMFIDLDGFKRVNDLHGHPVGDKVLKEVARRLQQQIRTSDTVARVGGDEFVVLLDNPASPDEVTHIAERIVGIVGDLREVSGHPVSLGASIGIAIHGVHGLGPEDLLSNADAAMYAVKAAGKAGWRFHRPEAAPDAVCAGGRLSDPRAP